jgi:hypothetical protein
MSYTITVRVFNTNPNAFFRLVEQTVFTDGTWDRVEENYVFTMGYSGTAGSLRFVSDTDPQQNFIATVGVHNYLRWCDIVTDLTNRQTGVVITPQYYSDQYPDRERQRETQLSSCSIKNAQGRQFSVQYTVNEGQNLKCDIIIG